MAKKTKKAELLFPLTVKDEVTWIGEHEYKRERGIQLAKKYKKDKVHINGANLEQFLKLIRADKELDISDDSIPEQMRDAFELVLEDYQAALEHQKELEKVVEDEKNKSLQVVTAALELDKVDRAVLAKKFHTGSNFVEVLEGTTPEEVAQQLGCALVMKDYSDYASGDLGNWLKANLPDGEFIIDNICAKMNKSASTVYNNMRMCSLLPKEQRPDNLVPSTLREIFLPRLDDDEKKDLKLKQGLLKEAVNGSWNSKEARSHVNAKKEELGRKSGRQGNASKKGELQPRYLIVDLADIESGSYFTDDFDSFDPETQHIFDLEARTWASKSDTGALIWNDVPFTPKEKSHVEAE